MTSFVTDNEAYEAGGYRERYAISHGTKEIKTISPGHRLWIFRYSTDDPYQDANGSTYDCKLRRWVG